MNNNLLNNINAEGIEVNLKSFDELLPILNKFSEEDKDYILESKELINDFIDFNKDKAMFIFWLEDGLYKMEY